MVRAEVAGSVVGIIANVISFGLFISPAPTFWVIIKRKSVEEFHPYAYMAASLNCMLWILYGLPVVHANGIILVAINSIGLVMELTYLAIFCIYDPTQSYWMCVLAELAMFAEFVLIAFYRLHTHTSRSFYVGILCAFSNIGMYASPFTIMKKVKTTKSVEYMPFLLSLAGFANGCIWTAYALIELDYFILISNGLGAICAFVQLVVYVYYYKSTPNKVQPIDSSSLQV